MKKKIEDMLSELSSEIKEFEKEYPISFCIMVEWKVAAGKREVLTELYKSLNKK